MTATIAVSLSVALALLLQTGGTPRIIGPAASNLSSADVTNLTQGVAREVGPAWLLQAHMQPPSWSRAAYLTVRAYLRPYSQTPTLRRGDAALTVNRTWPRTDPTRWTIESERSQWAQVALPGREFDDVRDIQRTLLSRGIALTTKADESTTGPASCVLVDPDGNQIFIDQHVPSPGK